MTNGAPGKREGGVKGVRGEECIDGFKTGVAKEVEAREGDGFIDTVQGREGEGA